MRATYCTIVVVVAATSCSSGPDPIIGYWEQLQETGDLTTPIYEFRADGTGYVNYEGTWQRLSDASIQTCVGEKCMTIDEVIVHDRLFFIGSRTARETASQGGALAGSTWSFPPTQVSYEPPYFCTQGYPPPPPGVDCSACENQACSGLDSQLVTLNSDGTAAIQDAGSCSCHASTVGGWVETIAGFELGATYYAVDGGTIHDYSSMYQRVKLP